MKLINDVSFGGEIPKVGMVMIDLTILIDRFADHDTMRLVHLDLSLSLLDYSDWVE